MRKAIAGWVLIWTFLAQGVFLAQTLEPKAMTREEIEQQLKSASKFTGTVTLNGKPLCSFDSDRAQSYPLGSLNRSESKPGTWAVVTATPTLVIKLSSDVPDRMTLTKIGGGSDMKLFVFQKVSGTPLAYNVRFVRSPGSKDSPGPGDFEFGTTKGAIALFFRCGFTIQEKAP